ncbi:MAG: hypothetical protein HRU46_18900 [Verrucomicrobiales bacterium]|nr:hypothetical protein [Verrucomicrobiales bacterium]
MKIGKGWLFIALSYLCFAISACTPGGNGNGNGGGGAITGDGEMDTTDFLVTDFDPLNKWLDEEFEVHYKHMTPELIFDQDPLNSIFYQTEKLPTNAEPFNFSSSGVTRRELLKRISSHWKLKMSIVEDANGNPTSVLVQG